MKKIIVLFFLTCLASSVFCQSDTSLPEELWGLKMGEMSIDQTRSILVERGLKITSITGNNLLAEGDFSVNGIEYESVICGFTKNKLAALMITGVSKDISVIVNQFKSQFAPVETINEAEKSVMMQMVGIPDGDIYSSKYETKGRMCFLIIPKDLYLFVLTYVWADVLNDVGNNVSTMANVNNEADDITKFMGIPVDGTYEDMKNRLVEKGFKPVKESGVEFLYGVFNGVDVMISIVTNENKVCRIAVTDRYASNAGDIITRYNNLDAQFMKNNKYFHIGGEHIDRSDNIHYEMNIKNKRYQMIYIQRTDYFNRQYDACIKDVMNDATRHFSQYDIDNNYQSKVMPFMVEKLAEKFAAETWNAKVWYTISEESYDKYRIIIFYDNEKNMAGGEDL